MTNQKTQKPKPRRPKYHLNQEVYLTAFLRGIEGVFYVCKGVIRATPPPNERQIYKVEIIAVADKGIGAKEEPIADQAKLLGLKCSKKTIELNTHLPPFITPSAWIESKPKDQQHYVKKPKKPKRRPPKLPDRRRRYSSSQKDRSGQS